MNKTTPKRRRVFSTRFGLRSLLLFTFVIAAVAGWGVSAYRTGMRHEEISKQLRGLGCYPSFSHEEIDFSGAFISAAQVVTETRSTLPGFIEKAGLGPVFRRINMVSIAPGAGDPEEIAKLVGQLDSIESLGIYVHLMSSQDLATAIRGKPIERLYLRHCDVGADATFLDQPKLKWLTIEYGDLNNGSAEHLPTSLEHLAVIDCPLDDDCVSAVQRLRNLKRLDLKKTDITQAGIAAIRKALPECSVTFQTSE